MKTINIDFTDSTVGNLGRAGEHNNTEIIFALSPELAKCDFLTAEIGTAAGDKVPVEGTRNEENNTFSILLTDQLTAEGKISLQIVGYVTESETAEPQIIAKSPVVSGFITEGINGVETAADSNPNLLARIWMKIREWADKIHTHDNKDTLDKLGESGEILTYNGKKIVDETTLRVVSEYKQLIETKSDVMLVYVSKNRYGFTPLTLETGVIYGKESYGADKDTLYVDVELNNFFPCQPFVVVTENINHRDYNTHYEFATDGTSYFCYKRYQDEQMVYIHFFNNSDNSIEMDGFTFPSNGWSSCQYNFVIKEWGMVYKQIDDPALTSSNWGLSEGVKFSTNEHFTELENILSAQDPLGIYKGTYQSYNKKWVQVNFAQISINSNSAAESIGANAEAIESLQKQFAAFEGEVTELEAMIDESGVLDE